MKRREFLGAPAALLGLGLVGGFSGVARAADGVAEKFIVLRLAGSGGEAEITGAWQESWTQVAANLRRAKVTVHGMVQAAVSSLGAVDVESAFFGSGSSVNMALVYVAADKGQRSGSGPISFYAQAPAFGGFVLTPGGAKRKTGVPTSVSLGEARTGQLTTGRYVILHSTGKRFNASEYLWSGNDDRPLMRRDGRAVDADYLIFDLEPA